MKKLLFITIIMTSCYNAHYYPSQDEPVQVDDNGQPIGDININVEQPRQPQPTPTKTPRKYPKCIKWEK